MNSIDWLYTLKRDVGLFLKNMKGKVKGGYYRYSYSGDLVDEHTHWGLGNAVFATKALYTIGALDEVDGKKEKKKLAEFITSFQRPDGCIYDPLVARGRLLNSIKHAVRTLDFSNIRSVKTIRAETRQAMSSLRLLGAKPQYMFSEIPYTSEGIERYLVALNWCDPWSAGSHFSHLLFFYDYNASVFSYRQAESQQLIGKAIDYVNKMQSNKEGVWYQGMSTSLQHKINGAMKILTGLKATGQMNFLYPDRMIDLALSAVNDGQACDNFNIVFVLKNANEMTGGSHRLNEIQDFCKRRLEIYREYYHSDIGGFSFYRGHSNTTYYGARITRGLNEPDVHGTCLFLWGIALIIQILGVQEQFKFNEFIA